MGFNSGFQGLNICNIIIGYARFISRNICKGISRHHWPTQAFTENFKIYLSYKVEQFFMINSLTNYNNMELVIKENECCVMELTRNMTKRLGQPRLNRCLRVSVSNNDVFSLDFNP